MAERREEQVRVTALELFFDLVFVFTITQLTYVLAHHPDAEGLLQVALMLGVIWWMYGGFAWLTNAVAPDRDSRRLLLLGGMACFMVIALAIPTAFEGDGVIFAAAYFAVIRALSLGAGGAAFFAGEVAFRRALGLEQGPWRPLAAVLALATVPLGTEGSALLQLAVLVPAMALCLLADKRVGDPQAAGAR